MSGIAIRPGTPADLDQVMAISSQSYTAAHWRPTDYQQIFSSSRILLVAEDANQIIGFLIAHNIAGDCELENIAVSSDHRQRGIGQQLVSALFCAIRSNATKSIFLEVRESNSAARKLYERCGFHQYGSRKSYYSNPSEDAVLYRFLCTPATLENY